MKFQEFSKNNGTIISTFFVLPSSEVLSVILTLDLND